MNRFFLLLTLISTLLLAACPPSKPSSGSLATDTSTHTLSGTVDSQSTTQSGGSSAPVAGAAVHVIDFTGQEVSTSMLATDSTGKYSLPVPGNTTYSVKVEKSGAVMKSLVKVDNADATSHVNPGSSAAVAVFQKKFSATIGEANTSFRTALDNVDIAATATNVYNAPSFGSLASTVRNVVAANSNPFTDSTVDTRAQTVAQEVTVVHITTTGTAGGGSGTGTCFCETNYPNAACTAGGWQIVSSCPSSSTCTVQNYGANAAYWSAYGGIGSCLVSP